VKGCLEKAGVRDFGVTLGTLLDMGFQDLAICLSELPAGIGDDLFEAQMVGGL
jgi:hypothetical protein